MRTSIRNVRQGGLALAAALAFVAIVLGPAATLADVPLYEVTVPLKGATEADRTAGLADALRAVAVKASGRREAADNATIAAALPSKYVQRYSTTADRRLKVGFDGRATEQLLQQAGLPLWPAERPVTLVSAPGADPAAIEAAAQWRGLPMAWSAGDSVPTGSARALLTGELSGSGFSWTFTHEGRNVQGRGSPQDGVDLAADTLAARYAPASTRANTSLTLRIGGMDDLAAYTGLLAYLRSLSLVRDVEIVSLEAAVVTLRLVVRGDRELLARIAAFDGRLQPVPPSDTAATASFDFQFEP